ncbi:hypothetical protein BGZ68_004065 [Mortierella alpina]|nr:hypothetical protein BGZ68_004065 [Mortierella alpina]
MLGPWPVEESRARDECTRILHRMREQLNVVINLQTGSVESCSPERSYHHYQQGQNELMEDDDECAFEEAFDEPAYQDPMLGLDHTVGDDRETFGSHHTADDKKSHGNNSLHKAFYTPQDGEDEDIEELAVLRPRMDVVSAGQPFD